MTGLLAIHWRRHRHQWKEHRPPARCRPAGGRRRVAAAALLHAGRGQDRTRCRSRGNPEPDNQHQGRIPTAATATSGTYTSSTEVTEPRRQPKRPRASTDAYCGV